MSTIHRSALLPFTAQQMYALINDVEAYPQFMKGCVGAQILSQDSTTMEARLNLAKAGLKCSFTTRNTLIPAQRITLELVEGPFSALQGEWDIEVLAASACKVSLSLQFTLANTVLGLATKTLFSPLADNLVDSIVKRAHYLYQ